MDGHTITSLELHASDGSTLTKQLTEVGVIATPTQTKTQTITSNGTIDIDVTNYKTIRITTNVSSESGGDTPVEPPTDEPTTKSKNLIEKVVLGESYYLRGDLSWRVDGGPDTLTVVLKVKEGHKYKGMHRNGYGNTYSLTGSNNWYVTFDDIDSIPNGYRGIVGETVNFTNGYIFSNNEGRYVEATMDGYVILRITCPQGFSTPEDLMIYDYTENGLLSTFEEWSV